MSSPSSDVLVAAHGIAPLPEPGGFRRRLACRFERWAAADARRRDAEALERMPEHLLYDIGITRDGAASLARRLRATPDR